MGKKNKKGRASTSITCIKKGSTPLMYSFAGQKTIDGQLVDGILTEMRCLSPTSSAYNEICNYATCAPADCSIGKGDPSCSLLCLDVAGDNMHIDSCEECISTGYIWSVFCAKKA